MTTKTITLPTGLMKLIEKQAEDGNYASPEGYIDKLVRRDWVVRKSLERIQRRSNGREDEEAAGLDVEEIIGTARMMSLLRSPGNDG